MKKIFVMCFCVFCFASCNVREVDSQKLDLQQQNAVEEIKKRGGTVKKAVRGGITVGFDNTGDTDELLARNLEPLQQLKEPIILSITDSQVSDAGLVTLKEIPHLEYLMLDRSEKITDDGLKHLTPLTEIKHLSLGQVNISDSGIEHLKKLANLEYLRIRDTKITDAGLEHLKGLKRLNELDLSRTEVTDEGVQKLQTALPKCHITW